MLKHAGLDTVEVPVAGEIRSNVSLTQADGTVTKINESGPCLDDGETAALIDAATGNPTTRTGWCAREVCPPACRSICTRS